MIINIGTINTSKIETIKELEGFFDWFVVDKIIPYKISSGVSDQPMSLEETILGATNRAKEAFKQSPCDFGIGIESGIMPSSQAGTGYFACEACVFWDGEKEYIGIGGGFQYPKPVLERVITYGENLSIAFKNAGFTEDDWIGNKDGIIGYLTQGKLPRKEYAKQIAIYALSQIHHKHLF